MKRLLPLLVLSAGAAFAATTPRPVTPEAPLELAPVLASQFSAVLHARSGNWQLFEADGTRLQFQAEGCPSNALLPRGLWLLTRDGEGQPQLVAPSATELPAGHDGRIALRGCGSAQPGRAADASLQLPASWIDTLEQHGSAILIAD